MYINLPFKTMGITRTRPVNIILNIGCLEDICAELKIEYHQINKFAKDDPQQFTELLMYYGYLAGCKQDRRRPKHNKRHAKLWAQKMTVDESAKLFILMTELYGKLDKAAQTDSKKKS